MDSLSFFFFFFSLSSLFCILFSKANATGNQEIPLSEQSHTIHLVSHSAKSIINHVVHSVYTLSIQFGNHAKIAANEVTFFLKKIQPSLALLIAL